MPYAGILPWPSIVLVAVSVALIVAACWSRKRPASTQQNPYPSWDEFVRDVVDSDVPIDHILARCGGKLPPRTKPPCVACRKAPGAVRHPGALGAWTHCDRCSAGCPACENAEIHRRIDAEHRRIKVGGSPCSFCQQFLGGDR